MVVIKDQENKNGGLMDTTATAMVNIKLSLMRLYKQEHINHGKIESLWRDFFRLRDQANNDELNAYYERMK